MEKVTHDLLVIGGGPGGYVAAIRAAQLGLNVGCIEQEPALGGTCLRVGCIPSKALLQTSEKYVEAQSHLSQLGIKVSGVELDLGQMLRRKDDIVKTLTGGVGFLFKKHKVMTYHGIGRLDGPGRAVATTADGEVEIQAKHIILATGSKS